MFQRLNPLSRVALCGVIAESNLTEPYGMKTMRSVLVNRVDLRAFIVSDRQDLYLRAVGQLAKWVAQGKIKYYETVTEGLRNALHRHAEGRRSASRRLHPLDRQSLRGIKSVQFYDQPSR